MKKVKIVLFLSPYPWWSHAIALKKPLITGIVDRIKISSEQLLPFSESELPHTFCKLHEQFLSVSFISRW